VVPSDPPELFTVLGPYQLPHICSQSRGYAAIYSTWALSASSHKLPLSRLRCYLQYLGLISLPTYTPKSRSCCYFRYLVPLSLPRYYIMLPRSRLRCYLRYLGLISLSTYAPKVEVMLLFTILGAHQPPHTCSQSQGYAAIYFVLCLGDAWEGWANPQKRG